jgi:hypothetical protein
MRPRVCQVYDKQSQELWHGCKANLPSATAKTPIGAVAGTSWDTIKSSNPLANFVRQVGD